MKHKLIVTTGNEIAGRPIAQYLGVVRGLVVRSPTFGQRFSGGLAQFGAATSKRLRRCVRKLGARPMPA
jgi:uncharacterized protein YbjQ (UPF0145 family)